LRCHRAGEPEKPGIIQATLGHTLIGPGSIPWEVGNAFSAMLKQKRIRIENAHRAGLHPCRYVRRIMKTTHYLMVIFIVAMTSIQALAEAIAPQFVITAFVEALQKNDMEYLKKYVDLDMVKQQPKHGYSVERLKALFADVDVSKIESSKPIADEKTGLIRVRMKTPLSFDFELQHQNAVEGKGDFYRIVGIHP
jgi:hypothetical protein